MKKILLLAALAASACAAKDPNAFTLTGTVDKAAARDSVRLVATDADGVQRVLARTLTNAEGVFVLKGSVGEPQMAMLEGGNERRYGSAVVEPGAALTVEIPYEGGALFHGTPANEALSSLSKELEPTLSRLDNAAGESQADSLMGVVQSAMTHTVRANSDNLAGAFLLNSAVGQLPYTEGRQLFDGLSANMQNSAQGLATRKVLDAMSKTEIGQPFMEIALPSADGTVLKLSEIAAGRWTLLDFWASWCRPCRGEMPFLRQAMQKYSRFGFIIYGVSLDRDQEAWKQAMEADQMTWPNVLGYKTPTIDAYGVRIIPTNFLLSPEGKIVARNLRGEELLKKLDELGVAKGTVRK